MHLETILSSLENIPRAAIFLFVVLGVVLAAEIWYLRPKRKLPPIPKTEEVPSAPLPSLEPTGFRPLSRRQILAITSLLILLTIIPLGAFLLKQTWEAKKRIVSLPSPLPTIIALPTPRLSPLPTPLPSPSLTASPSATPGKLAVALPTPKPTISPTPSPTPTKSPQPPGKGAPETPSPSPKLPSVEKPKELPDASVSEQLILLTLLSLSALSIGIISFKRGGPRYRR